VGAVVKLQVFAIFLRGLERRLFNLGAIAGSVMRITHCR
jgi:Fe2+ transport system protein FeoA